MPEQFEHASATGIRVRCVTCGASGYPGGRWQEKHLIGHPYKCPECDLTFTTGMGVSAHHRNVHRADRFVLYAQRANGVRAHWQRRREARGMTGKS